MIKVFEAPNLYNNSIHLGSDKLFLAGGITNCPDWQSEAIQILKEKDKEYLMNVFVLNPRRQNFPIDDPNAAMEQIAWEYKYLEKSNIILFWFSSGSLNPIVLYELGMWGNSKNAKNKKIFIGCDKEYSRIQDVTIQTQ